MAHLLRIDGIVRTAREAKHCKSPSTAKTALLRYVYRIRSKILHKITASMIHHFHQCYNNNNIISSSIQLLILGCGLDESYDVYSATIYCVDFEAIIAERMASHNIGSSRDHLHFVTSDIRDVECLLIDLRKSSFDVSLPTLIICECVLCYMDLPSRTHLLNELSRQLYHPIALTYDPILSSSNHMNGYATEIKAKFEERQAPLLSSMHSITDTIDHYHSCGWNHCISSTISQALQCYLSPQERRDISSSIPTDSFDEYASLALLNHLYTITMCSTNGMTSSMLTTVHEDLMRWSRTDSDGSNNNDSTHRSSRLNQLRVRISMLESRVASIETSSSRTNNHQMCDKEHYHHDQHHHYHRHHHNPRGSWDDKGIHVSDIDTSRITSSSSSSGHIQYSSVEQFISFHSKQTSSIVSSNNSCTITFRAAKAHDADDLRLMYEQSLLHHIIEPSDSSSSSYSYSYSSSIRKYIKKSSKALQHLERTYNRDYSTGSILLVATTCRAIEGEGIGRVMQEIVIGCIGIKVCRLSMTIIGYFIALIV